MAWDSHTIEIHYSTISSLLANLEDIARTNFGITPATMDTTVPKSGLLSNAISSELLNAETTLEDILDLCDDDVDDTGPPLLKRSEGEHDGGEKHYPNNRSGDTYDPGSNADSDSDNDVEMSGLSPRSGPDPELEIEPSLGTSLGQGTNGGVLRFSSFTEGSLRFSSFTEGSLRFSSFTEGSNKRRETITSQFRRHALPILHEITEKQSYRIIPAYSALGDVLSVWIRKLYRVYELIHMQLESIRRSLIKCERSQRRAVLSEVLVSYLRKHHSSLLPDIDLELQSRYIDLTYRSFCAFRGGSYSTDHNANARHSTNHNANDMNDFVASPLTHIRNYEHNLYIVDNLVDLVCNGLSDLTILRFKLRFDVFDTSTLTHEFCVCLWDEFERLILRTLQPKDYEPLPRNDYIADQTLRYDIIRSTSLIVKSMDYSFSPEREEDNELERKNEGSHEERNRERRNYSKTKIESESKIREPWAFAPGAKRSQGEETRRNKERAKEERAKEERAKEETRRNKERAKEESSHRSRSNRNKTDKSTIHHKSNSSPTLRKDGYSKRNISPTSRGQIKHNRRSSSSSKKLRFTYPSAVFAHLVGQTYFAAGYVKCVLQTFRDLPAAAMESSNEDWIRLQGMINSIYHHLNLLYQFVSSTDIRRGKFAIEIDFHYQRLVSLLHQDEIKNIERKERHRENQNVHEW
jgi:hypothetical protein